MIPKKACPGLDPGWDPVFGKDHAQTNGSSTVGRGLMARSRSRKKSAAKPARRLRKQRAVAESPATVTFAKRPPAKSPLGKSPLGKSPLGKSPLGKSPPAKPSAAKSPADAPSVGVTGASLVAYAHD